MYTHTVRFMVLKEESYVHRGCIYMIKNKLKTLIVWNVESWEKKINK